ncbi:MAG TPA: hypothetical protein DC054_01680 [Blastocatellia bacterium]|nr:hypothetical protein [Blastocatellia bacterium]
MRRINLMESHFPFICTVILTVAVGGLSSAVIAQPQQSPAANQESAEEVIKRGLNEFEKGDYKAALELFTQAIALKPDDPRAYFYKGMLADETIFLDYLPFPHDPAVKEYTKAIELNPKYADAYFRRGLDQWELEKKIADFDLAIQNNPRYARAYYQRGMARTDELPDWLQRAGDIAFGIFPSTKTPEKDYLKALEVYTPTIRRAIEDFTEAIRIEPDFTDAYFERARASAELKDYKSAVEDFLVVLRREPANVGAHYKLGLAHFDLGDYRKAIEDFTHALELKPGNSTYYSKRGLARFKLGDKDGALDDYLQSLRGHPDKLPKDYLQTLKANPKINDAYYATIEEFLPEILGGVQDKNKVAEVYYERAMLSRYYWSVWGNEDEDTETTIQNFTEAIQHRPGYADAYYQRALVYYERKEDASAVGDFTQAIQLSPQDGSLYYNRGLVNYRLKNWRAAINDFTRALELSPEMTNAFYQRGLAYFQVGADPKAKNDFTRSLKDELVAPDSYYHLGLIYERAGAKEKAIERYLQVVRIISPKELEQRPKRSQLDANLTSIYCRGLARLYLGPRIVDVHVRFSEVRLDQELAKKDLLDQSEQDFTDVIRRQPRFAEAYYQRGRSRLASRVTAFSEGKPTSFGANTKDALEDFSRAIQLKPRLGPVYFTRGQFYAESFEPLKAINDFTQAIRIDPNNAAAYYERGEVYNENYQNHPQDLNAALADFTQVIRIDPGNVNAYAMRVSIREDQNNPQGAIEDCSKIIRFDPAIAAGVYSERGNLRRKLKDFRGALDDYNRAIELNPSEPGSDDAAVAWAYYYRAVARYNLGDGRGANEDYKQALLIRSCLGCKSGSISINPTNKADAFLFRGLSFLRRGDKKASRENLEQAARLYYAQGNMTQYQMVRYQLSKL